MKKQTVVLVWSAILLIIVAVCIGVYCIWGGTQGYTKNQSVVAFNCVSTDIEEYTVVDKNVRQYTLERSDGEWSIEDNSKIELDQDKVGKLISSVSNITATGTVSRKDFEKLYTKDEKRIILDIDNAENAEIRFLGSYESLCAFKVSGDKKIYVMNTSMRDVLAPKLDTLRITTVFTELSKIDTMPDYYRYRDYDGSVVEIRSKTASELAKGKDNRYIMESPYKREIDDNEFEQKIALKIPLITIKSYVKKPKPYNPEAYGLDEASRAELNFRWDKANETLYLGKTENGAVYAETKNSVDIFTIETSQLEFLKLDPFYVLDGGLLKAHISNIQSIDISIGDAVYTIVSEGKKTDTPKFYVCGKTATREVFEDILEELGDMKLLSELTEVPKNTKDILIKVNYDNGAGGQTISLAKLNNKNYAAFIDGKAEFAIDGETVADLVEEVVEAYRNPMKRD